MTYLYKDTRTNKPYILIYLRNAWREYIARPKKLELKHFFKLFTYILSRVTKLGVADFIWFLKILDLYDSRVNINVKSRVMTVSRNKKYQNTFWLCSFIYVQGKIMIFLYYVQRVMVWKKTYIKQNFLCICVNFFTLNYYLITLLSCKK